MKDVLGEKELPEAPASLNVRGYLKGFSIQITKRGEVAQPLLEQSIKIVDWMEANGFKPSWNEQTNGKVYSKTETGMPFPDDNAIKAVTCDKCGEQAEIISGVKNNRKWQGKFCSTGNKSHTTWL